MKRLAEPTARPRRKCRIGIARGREPNHKIRMTVAITRFGSAHWSVLQHVGACARTQPPYRLDRTWMRCNEQRHPDLSPPRKRPWEPALGTMLAGYDRFRGDAREAAEAGCQILDHDDWDCLDDLCRAELVEMLPQHGHARLTQAGQALCEAIAGHLAAGGSIAEFRWPPPTLN